MNKLLLVCSIAFIGFMSSCSEKLDVQQPQSTVDNTTTARISAVIKTEYPTATNLSVSTIDDKKVYSCDFSVSGVSHESAVSASGQILSVYSSKDITLPEAIVTYLNTTYTGYKLEKAVQGKDASGKTSYKVLIEHNDQKIIILFDDKYAVVATFAEPKNNVSGDKNKVFATKLTDLPANIQSQLTGYEFIGAVVKSNSDNSKKTYFVTAKKDGILYEFTFDNDGKLTKTKTFDPNKKIENKLLKESDLPQVIRDYIKINYKDWKYEQGITLMKDGSIDGYSLVLSKDKKLTLLSFDKDGKFLKAVETPTIQFPKIEDKAITVNDLPQTIKDYLNKTYAGWTLTKGVVTLKDNVTEAYYVYITVGADKYHVYFDKNGKFLLAKRG
jgi:hypothetical protein